MEVRLKVEELKTSTSNVRSSHTKEDIEMMANSIKRRGIINPPTVAKNGDGRYEVIAGLLRYKGAVAAGLDEIPVVDITALTPMERVEISLAVNIDRRQMSAIEYHAAFNKLFKAGMTVPTIAARFDKDEREVQQLLAIGSLPKKILDAAEAGEIQDRTLRALAIANGQDVTRYAKLKKDERPRDYEIQEWLAGNDGMYREDVAIFDLDLYKGPKIVDLFGEQDETWLRDGGQFWELQNEAINAQLAAFIKSGWECEQVDNFQEWSYDKTKKADGGKILYTIRKKTGQVSFHKGYTHKKAAGKQQKAKAGTDEPKPEVSKTFIRYTDELRNAAVKRYMLDDCKAGMVATLLLLLKQSDNIQFRVGSNGLSDELSDSLHSDSNLIVVCDDYLEMLTELNLQDGHLWQLDIETVGEQLINTKPATLRRWINTVVARNWDINEPTDSDAIGKAIGLSEVPIWEADDAFWNGIKNKQTLLKIADELDITASEKEPTKIIRKRLAEKRSDTWRPSWLKF